MMNDWQFAELSEEQLAEIRSLEKKLKLSLVAFENENEQDENEKMKN